MAIYNIIRYKISHSDSDDKVSSKTRSVFVTFHATNNLNLISIKDILNDYSIVENKSNGMNTIRYEIHIARKGYISIIHSYDNIVNRLLFCLRNH